MFSPRTLFLRFARNFNLIRLSLLLAGTLLALASPASAKTAMQTYVEAMQPGTNWGNTFDATPNETSWGMPTTTQVMIQGLVAKGYKSLRLPVTWNNHIGPAPTYTIDSAWMNTVQQVVDWALAANLYVMLNMHHDGWVGDMGHDHDAVLDKYQKVWRQIATRFKDYPNKLMFESKNEPGFQDANGKDLSDAQMRTLLDELNTAFFNVVRGIGGGNATRPLVLPSVYTRSDQPMIDSLKATIAHLNDPNLIATIHYYGWFPFSVNMANSPQFDTLSINSVHESFDAVYNTFVVNGVPIIVGEWGLLAPDSVERGECLKYF
jgi:aryl-phospho-beta-D-glucosidase BglC (GH1 family)